MIPGVFAAHAAASRHQVTFGDLIFDHDFNVGKCPAELSVKGHKSRRPAKGTARVIRQAVRDPVSGEHLRDSICTAITPDLFEPTANEGFVLFEIVSGRHEELLSMTHCYSTSLSSR